MSMLRPPKMLIDNLQQMAADLYNYLNSPLSKSHLLADINEMKKKYKAPLDSWIVGSFYQYFRTRTIDIEVMINKLSHTDEATNWIDDLVNFFQKGEWDTTSANTTLMLKCIQKLPGYTEQDGKEFFSNKAMMTRLNILLLKHAVEVKEKLQKKSKIEDDWLEGQKKERLLQLNDIPWPKIAAKRNEIINCISTISAKTMQPTTINKLSQNIEYNYIIPMLEKSLFKPFSQHTNATFFQKKGITNMSQSRITLLKILKYQFHDTEIKLSCRQSIKDSISKGLITRAFDHDKFPFSIVSYHELTDLIAQFNKILLSIKVNSEMELVHDEDIEAIMQFEMRIIKMGCDYLLDASGHVSQELLILLGIKEQFSSKDTVGLICAYVGRVNEQVMTSSKDLIDQHSNTLVGICNLVNKKYGDWVIDRLKQLGHLTVSQEEENQAYWAAAGIGMGLLVSAAAFSLFFFKKYSSAADNGLKIKHNEQYLHLNGDKLKLG